MDMFEEANALLGMIRMLSLTQEEIAGKMGVSQSYVANKLRLLRFSPAVREKIVANGLSERHARALLRLEEENTIFALIEQIARDALTVQATEELVDALLAASDKGGAIETVYLIERLVYSYMSTIHGFGARLRKTVEEKDGTVTLTFFVEGT